jgi:Contractile injection system tube protein
MTFPGSPRLVKGAIVGLDPLNPLASVVIFQYNPDTLTRTVQARAAAGTGDGSQSEALRLKGPPEETIRLDVEVDATDQMERGDAITGQFGVAPALASLEMLLYPKSATVIANEVLAKLGIIEVVPPEAPLTLFVWGLKRVLPVRISELTITEEAFDSSLNPIRVKVGLSLRVLSYDDLGLLSVGGGLFLAHQVVKEVMATLAGASAVGGALSGTASFSAGVGVGG